MFGECIWCGYDANGNNPTEEKPQARKVVNCVTCGHDRDDSSAECKKCRATEPEKSCSICIHHKPEDSDYCLECGFVDNYEEARDAE